MKKIILSSLFIAFSIFAIAQNANDDYYNSSVKPKLLSTDRVSASIMAGTSVSFSSDKTSSVSTFIAPKINYQLTDRFRLNVGLMHCTSYPNTLLRNKSENSGSANKRNYSSDLVFIGGEYQLNNKVSVSGAVMTDASTLNHKQNNYKAAEIGLDYKVTKHSSIGIRAGISQGSQDYMYNPKNNNFDYYPSTDRSNGLFTGLGQWGVEELNRGIR
jgi:hypothetical protein